MKKLSLDLSTAKIGAIVNTASGSYNDSSKEKLLEILKLAGCNEPHLWLGGPGEVRKAFAEVARRDLDILIVLGGDGTIRSAAQACLHSSTYLIPLPGGTLNMLPRALYGNLSWEDALKTTLASPKSKKISGGRIGDEYFYIAAIIGAPALWADSREAIRKGDIGGAIEKGVQAFQNMFALRIQYKITLRKRGSAEAISIICPLISSALSDTTKALEVAFIDIPTAADVLSIASAAAFTTWREAENISITKTKRLHIWSEKDIPVIVDGETVSCGEKIEVEFVPHAFTALVP
jgi:diacylglycerol kinase family enzyme